MNLRISDSTVRANIASSINAQRQRLASAQEQLSSGKRINRPSDDPGGAGAVLRIRTSKSIGEQFTATISTVKDRLLAADGGLNSYEQRLDRARTLLSQGASDTTTAESRAAIATEVEGLRTQILSVANMRSNEQFVFGGTRQDIPPVDPVTYTPAATPTTDPLVQFEPDTPPVSIGTTADKIFADANGTVFQMLTDVAAALRGTGNAAADQATIKAGLDRLVTFGDQASVARTKIGVNINTADGAADRLSQNSLSLEGSLERVEAVDFVATALDLTNAQNAFDATLRASANSAGRKSLIDFLG